MAQQPIQQTIKQTTMIVEEEFAPPRPDSDRSPRSQALTRQPTQKDTVEPVLVDMIKLANFGLKEFYGEIHKHLYDVRSGLNDNVNALHNIRNKIVQSDPIVENGTQFITEFMQMWINNGQYFTQVYNECENPNSTIPDLRNVKHPSPEITQEAYKQLIWNTVLLCQRAERQMRLQDLMYCTIDETLEETKGKLDETVKALRYFEDVCTALEKGDSTLLQKFGEGLRKANTFLSEWKKGGDQFNQPSPQRVSEAGARRPCPTAPTSPPSPATPESIPGTPVDEIEARVKTLQGKKTEMVEELLRRYNELSKTVLREVQNTRDLEQSVIDMHKTT